MSGLLHKGWHGVAIAASLGTVGMIFEMLYARSIPGTPMWPFVASAATCVTVLILLLAGLRGPRLTGIAFVVINVSMALALWASDSHYALAVPNWVPFRPHQLGIVAVALLAPEALWSGIVAIVFIVGTAVAHYYVWDAAVRMRLVSGAPSVMIIYGIFGMALLAYRWKSLAAERARAAAETEAAAILRLARSFLALRDLANTPLQTIALTVMVLRQQHPELKAELDRVERALARLRESNRILSKYDAYLPWEAGDESFSALELLQRSTTFGPKPS